MKDPPRLQYIVEDSFKRFGAFKSTADSLSICKIEQMSNWERRPLRQTQVHYAAVDAYVLSVITSVIQSFQDYDVQNHTKKIENV
jgi:hypothetical protein